MADDDLLGKVHSLSDLELAILLCLVNREHVLISTPPAAIDDLVQELQLVCIQDHILDLFLFICRPNSGYVAQIASKTFNLQSVVVNCHPSTTLEDFACALLLQPQQPPLLNATTVSRSASPFARADSYFALNSQPNQQHRSSTPLSLRTTTPFSASPQIAHFVIAKNLDRAPRVVQIQALELLRTRRIFTRTSVQAAPKQFVFVPVLGAASGGEAHVTAHLNDFFSVAHWHNPDDGYVNLDEAEGRSDGEDATASTESVVKKGMMPSTALISDIVSSSTPTPETRQCKVYIYIYIY